MKNTHLAPLCVIILIFGVLLISTGCRVFDSFGKDSANQPAAPYKPPARIETLEEEQPAVQARTNEFSQALIAKDVDKAVEFCAKKDIYKKMFENDKDKMPFLGQALKNAKLTDVGAGYTYYGGRIGELTVDVGTETFTINIVKDNGLWYFQDL